MTDPEREYFAQEMRNLERSRDRWRLAALAMGAVVALLMVLGGLTTLGMGSLWITHEREALRAMEAEMQARRAAEELARRDAERARQEALKLEQERRGGQPEAKKEKQP
jgi:hypothetical protein